MITKLPKVPTRVKPALKLLKKKARNIHLDELNAGSTSNCPIALAYNVTAEPRWDEINSYERQELVEAGWTGRLYRSFICWFDRTFEGKEHLFKRLLK